MTEALATLGARVEAHYAAVARGAMADLPLLNRALGVRLLGLQPWEGMALGVLVTPWAINLMLLPGSGPWPDAAPLSKQVWQFPSGDYPFVNAGDAGFGPYQSCSLFSPVLEFESMEAACATALAALLALLRPPMTLPEALPEALPEDAAPAAEPSRRRWLLGRAREGGR